MRLQIRSVILLGGLLESRRFWAAVIGIIVVITEEFGLPITEDQVTFIVMLIVGWIVGDSLDKTRPKGEGEAIEISDLKY